MSLHINSHIDNIYELFARSEEEKCVKYITKNTEVSTIWKISKTDVYSERKHSFIYKEDKICISQDPVLYCSNGSVAKDIRKKSIKYVCLPEGRVAKLYEARIQRGESPQVKHINISLVFKNMLLPGAEAPACGLHRRDGAARLLRPQTLTG